MKAKAASILVGLLWCLALLSVLVVGVLHSASMELRMVKNYGDRVQAHYLALAGIEKAKALLALDAANRRRSGQNHTGQLYDAPQEFKDVALGRGQFRLFHSGGSSEGGGVVYGLTDEESRLNLNEAPIEDLRKLPEMTPEIAAAIVDWRDEDNVATQGGAEAEYYVGLRTPYLPRNGPFQTTRELLMVRGVTRELFAGEDANLNGLLDPEEDDGTASEPVDNHDGVLDGGWSELVTVDSLVRTVSASGQARVDLQTADETSLSGVAGITTEIARAIVAHRRQNRFESLADLLDVTAPSSDQSTPVPSGPGPGQPQASGGSAPGPASRNASSSQSSGPKVIDESLLMSIADGLTVGGGRDQAGAVNINTASPLVLACLPGINAELAQAIVAFRQSSGFFANPAWLLKVPGITRETFKQLASRVTVRSETYRLLAEGKIPSNGARKRIQAIVRLGATEIETLSWREDL